MCGIFGFTNFSEKKIARARKALTTLQHRGPDQWNEYCKEDVYLGHRRLSILDLSENGRQPMFDTEEKVVITVNGEIYNFAPLKEELAKKYTFKSKSDSEVVLYGYMEWGFEELLERLDGMYSIIVFDKIKRQVFLARDRSGIKPLYYSHSEVGLVWASELKAIIDFQGEKNLNIDHTALYDFLTYQYVPTPKTMYQEVKKLPPAHFIQMDLDKNKIVIQQYWTLDVEEKDISIEEAQKEIFKLTKESIDEQMMSDVPVGFFLSGGMDSSVVVGLAAILNPETETFTIGFDNNPKDETHFAELVAKHFKTKHTKKILNSTEAKMMFDRIKEWYDEPFGDLSCFPTYLVSKISREHVTVVLTGDGGDELFGGYKWYKAFEMLNKYNLRKLRFMRKAINIPLNFLGKIPMLKKYAKRGEWMFLNELELYTRLMGGMLKEEKAELCKKWNIPDDYDDYWYFRKFYRKDLKLYTRLQYLDFHTYLHDDILTKVDRVSMAVSLECRVPFLSKKLIEYLFSIPQNIRIHQGELKGAMKEAFKELLPDQIINRPKEGFNIPTETWSKDVKGKHNNRLEKILKDVFQLQY